MTKSRNILAKRKVWSPDELVILKHLYPSTLCIGYNRAARLIEAMEADGIVSHMDKHGIRKMMMPNEQIKGIA